MKQNLLYKNTDSYCLTELLRWTFIHDEVVLSLSITPLPRVVPCYVPIIDIMTSKLFDQKRRTTGTIINFLDRILVGKKILESPASEIGANRARIACNLSLGNYKDNKVQSDDTVPFCYWAYINVCITLSLFLFLVDIRRLNLSNWQVIGCHITSFVEREMSLIVTVGRSAIKINVIPFVKKKNGFFLY